jgi:hypothetical protein
MVATVQIGEKNGTLGTFTQKDAGTIRFKNADDATVDLNNPMVIPTAGLDYSWDKWTKLKVTVAPDNNITNLKFYTDGANGLGTGVSLYAKAVTTYPATPLEATTTTGYADAFTYTSGAALDIGSAAYTGTGEKGNHAVLMMTVATNATQGNTGNEIVTYSYDET